MKRTMIGVLAFTMAACGGIAPVNLPASPEGRMAVYGRQGVAAVKQAATATDQLIGQGVLARTDGVNVLQVLREMTVQAENLADTLLIVDSAKTAAERTSGLARAADIVKAIQRLANQAFVPIGSGPARQAMVAIMQGIIDTLVDLSVALAGTEPIPLPAAA